MGYIIDLKGNMRRGRIKSGYSTLKSVKYYIFLSCFVYKSIIYNPRFTTMKSLIVVHCHKNKRVTRETLDSQAKWFRGTIYGICMFITFLIDRVVQSA